MVVVFFFANGARSCSIVGATFWRGLEVSWIERRREGLKKGVEGFEIPFAQEEHIQGAFLRLAPDKRRVNVFMIGNC